MNTRRGLLRRKKYYHPARSLVESLQNELTYLRQKESGKIAGVSQKLSNATAQRRFDANERVFQALVDVVYFLEFIEDHNELHEIYEDSLMDLFGISDDDSSPQPHHYKNRGSSLFSRFISASLFSRWDYSDSERSYDPIDFRVVLTRLLMEYVVQSISFRLGGDLRELQLFNSNIQNGKLWSELLASRYKAKTRVAQRRIGYSIGVTNRGR